MSFAVMKPAKVDVIDAVPPPPSMSRNDIPKPLNKPRTEEQIKKAQQEFENRATNHYYSEWFWFPYSDQIWLNKWEISSDKSGVKEYPSKMQIAYQWLQAIGMEAFQKTGSVGLISASGVCKSSFAGHGRRSFNKEPVKQRGWEWPHFLTSRPSKHGYPTRFTSAERSKTPECEIWNSKFR